MRSFKRTVLSLLLLCAGVMNLTAQVSTASSGGDATGPGGSVSYTIGQLDYVQSSGGGATVSQGVQQPYEIFSSSVEEMKGIELSASVMPNPVEGVLTLTIDENHYQNLRWSLFDMQGRQIGNNAITSAVTTFQMGDLSSGNYFLKISDNQKEIKSFKIIKNR
ncbi:MAG: T9SS type A sorting domain-containing protein [Bacteroidota bacterium]